MSIEEDEIYRDKSDDEINCVPSINSKWVMRKY